MCQGPIETKNRNGPESNENSRLKYILEEKLKNVLNFKQKNNFVLLPRYYFDNNKGAVAVTGKYPGYCHCY